MASNKSFPFKESVVGCLRLVQLMYTTDKKIGLIIISCCLVNSVHELFMVWVDSSIRTALQQLLAANGSREELRRHFIQLVIANLALSTCAVFVQRWRRQSEAKIKKKLCVAMTIKLLNSFCSLDFVTSNDPLVLKDFQTSRNLLPCSILSRANEVLMILLCMLKIILLLGSLLTQIRGREELMLLPLVAVLFGIESAILHSTLYLLLCPLIRGLEVKFESLYKSMDWKGSQSSTSRWLGVSVHGSQHASRSYRFISRPLALVRIPESLTIPSFCKT